MSRGTQGTHQGGSNGDNDDNGWLASSRVAFGARRQCFVTQMEPICQSMSSRKEPTNQTSNLQLPETPDIEPPSSIPPPSSNGTGADTKLLPSFKQPQCLPVSSSAVLPRLPHDPNFGDCGCTFVLLCGLGLLGAR